VIYFLALATTDGGVTPVLVDSSGLLALVVPALIAAAGYVAKLVADAVQQWHREKEETRARLHRLSSLLRASRGVFVIQRTLAGHLAAQLQGEHDILPGEGLEDLFVRSYKDFDQKQRDDHQVIRAYSEHAMRPLNEAMLTWLGEDATYRTQWNKTGAEATLADQLNQLDTHLQLWLAKYQAWIPDRPDHALVYLADEAQHGLGFPTGIDDTLAKVVSEMR
jgi:hypothetical protein